MHRLLAMNINGTVLQPNGRLHKSVKEGVQYVQNKGVKATLVTSQNYSYAKRIAKLLKINSFIIAHHGAFIAESVNNPIFVKRIPDVILYEILNFVEAFSSSRIVAVHEKITVCNQPPNNPILGRITFNSTGNSEYQQLFVDNVRDYLQEEKVQPTHIEVTFNNIRDAEDVKSAIEAMYTEVVVKHQDNQLIILPHGVSKLKGLLFLGDYWNIPLNQMVAIGSTLDDLEMIDAVGLGVAMGNSPSELKKAANWITRSNSQHGVYYMIWEHFRKQQPFSFIEKMKQFKE